MKKTLLALTAAASCAFIAKAGVLNQTGFETYDVTGQYGNNLNAVLDDNGGMNGQVYWLYSANGGLTESVITNYEQGAAYQYGEGNASIMVGAASDSPGNKFLSVDATDAKLIRTINAADSSQGTADSKAIGEGLFFDSLVQFTATDQPPVPEEGDKLVVWLYGNDDETSNALGLDDPLTTNLVVTAGLVDGMATSATNYVVTLPAGVTVEPGSWHRLTIKAYANITKFGAGAEGADEAKIGGFVVYIDGQPATCTASKGDFTNVGGLTDAATALGDKLFPSLISAGSAALTLTGVAFDGTGAIDDITFTDVDPFPEAAAETFTLTVTAANGTVGVYSDAEASDDIEGDGSYQVPLALETVYVTFMPATGYTVTAATFAGAPISVPELSTLNDYFFELAVPAGTASGDTLALVLTTSGGGEVPSVAVSVTGGANATAAWTVDNVAVQTAPATLNRGQMYSVTFTANEGYAFAPGAQTTFSGTAGTEAIVIAAPDAVAITTHTLTLTVISNATATYAVDGGAATAYTAAASIAEGSAIVITATAAQGYTYKDVDLTGTAWLYDSVSGVITYTINSLDADATVPVPAPAESQDVKTYPSYIDGDTAKGKYDAWAEYAKIGDEDFPDADNTNKDAYLLNCLPSEVATAAAAFKFTSISYDATKQKWVTTTTTSYNNRDYNGEVEVKSYSDVGCTTESETGNFFKATLK